MLHQFQRPKVELKQDANKEGEKIGKYLATPGFEPAMSPLNENIIISRLQLLSHKAVFKYGTSPNSILNRIQEFRSMFSFSGYNPELYAKNYIILSFNIRKLPTNITLFSVIECDR